MLSPPKILLVTFNWSTLTEMPYVVKQAGCDVHVLCPSNNVLIKTGFYDHWIDAGDSLNSLIAKLIQISTENIYTYILIGDDPILWKIYRENIVALKHLLPIRNKLALPMLNKIGFAEHCQKHAIPTPNFKAIDNKKSANKALKYLGLPLLIKVNYSNGGRGVTIFKDEVSYNEFINHYHFHEPLLVQQYVVGDIMGSDALFKKGQLLTYNCAVDMELTLGPATKRRYFPNNERIGDILTQLGTSAGLHGFANISLIKETVSQKYYIFEADPRPTKWIAYGKWFGCDFSLAFKAFLAEGESTDSVTSHLNMSEIDCWEVEFFPDHAVKLFQQNRVNEAIIHFLDFKKNVRYTHYDPILLEAKMDSFRNSIKFTNECS